MRFLIAFLIALVVGHSEAEAEGKRPPKAPPVYVPPKAPPVAPEARREVWPGYGTVELRDGRYYLVEREVSTPRPFPVAQSPTTPATPARPAAGASSSYPGIIQTGATITLAPAAFLGDTSNCASPFG